MATTWRKTLTAAAACFALALSGCGSQNSNDGDANQTTSAAPAPTSEAPETPASETPETSEAPADAGNRDLRALIEGVELNGQQPTLLSDKEVQDTINLAQSAGDGLGLEVEPAGCNELLNAAAEALAKVDPATIKMAMAVLPTGDSIVARTVDATIQKSITEFDQQLAQCSEMTVKFGDTVTQSSMEKLDVSDIDGAEHVIGMRSTVEVMGQTQDSVSLQAIKDGIVVIINGADVDHLDSYKDSMREVLSRI